MHLLKYNPTTSVRKCEEINMLMGFIWTGMIAISVLYGCLNGTAQQVQQAALDGAYAAIELCLGIGGAVCLWCAVMELMRASGLAAALSRALRPLLGRLFPGSAGHESVMQPLSANVSANLLGLGNAATPMGIRAAREMARLGPPGEASNELCRLVVLNTASIQLLPATTAAIRAACGAAEPFDILPAVWISSAGSVAAGLLAAKAMERRM